MIAPDFLQGCTDEQINMGVAWIKAKKSDISKHKVLWVKLNKDVLRDLFSDRFTPCTNPNDAWPIILENKIDIYFNSANTISGIYDGAYKHIDNKTGIPCENKNPLRAAMEVYLLMSNEK